MIQTEAGLYWAGKLEIPPPDIHRISAGYPADIRKIPDIRRISAGYPADIRISNFPAQKKTGKKG